MSTKNGFGPRAFPKDYWQFANGSVAPIGLDVLMRMALAGDMKIESAYDHRLGADVWYSV